MSEIEKKKKNTSDAAKLREDIIAAIRSGQLLPGVRLESERSLAQRYGVGRGAVRRVLRRMTEEGYLTSMRGSGTFVRQREVPRMDLGYLDSHGNAGISAMVKNYGGRISGQVLARGVIKEPCFARRLGLSPEGSVYVLHRVRFGNDEPIAVEYTYIPAMLFPDVECFDFAEVSLYDYMDARGRMPVSFHQKMRITLVNERERIHLQIPSGSPVFCFEFTGFDSEGTIVEYTESYVRCDLAEIKFVTYVR